ncbi:biotin synthase [Desulfocicer vacuolatum DSM 3385]|uniref:Biotin synthase n=1 Tax=Desulfocicer vacuolatum DSM 3385 TaxID=1121400 RepID=A0A1W2D601_9BACT|nr:radical SAM protein [Desulfocicer vacuolatum]SMC92646.1 biotin synthase [Desulfocicer vacuolatum DSM 3385]
MSTEIKESPAYLKTSLAAAMTLGYEPGLFYRNARLYCINLLLTYSDGCAARCAYCGLSGERPGNYDDKSFIRVKWPVFPLEDIIDRVEERKDRVKRFCISMVTHARAVEHTLEISKRLLTKLNVPVSVLLAPTLIKKNDLEDLKAAGVDKVGIAIDLATQELFDRYRGRGVGGPHRWDVYWKCMTDAVQVFGENNAGPHFMVGMGETEQEMCEVIQVSRDMGCSTHLFSFYPEPDSPLADHNPPPMDQYRRIQLARYLIDGKKVTASQFTFNGRNQVIDFGLDKSTLEKIIHAGDAFRTSGCQGRDGEVACNRPFGNSRPGPDIRNYPFPPEAEDVERIRAQMGYSK